MSFHLFHINELFSNASGSVQFIELVGDANGQPELQDHTLTVIQGGTTRSFTFPNDLPSNATLGASVLIATQGFADLGGVVPDYIIPAGFLFTAGGATVNFAEGSDTFVYTVLPTDGTNSLADGGSIGPASPTNFAGDSVITGTDAADSINGGAGRDTVSGGKGHDTLIGGDGNDILFGNTGNDVLSGDAGDDVLAGNTGADTLTGAAGNDSLNGGTGVDNMSGGEGDDTYTVAGTTEIVVENAGEGTDRVRASTSFLLAADVEHLTLLGSEDTNGIGNALDNEIVGNGGNNELKGIDGNDVLTGGVGADTITGGTGHDALIGGSGLDTLTGGSGNDSLNGGTSVDSMSGGTGDDVYTVSGTTDIVVENAGQGADRVRASSSFVLSENVEELTLIGTANTSGFGNTLDNQLTGNDGDNQIRGNAGNDTLRGGIGVDTLIGGAGADRLTGGAGNDLFRFTRGEADGDTLIDFDGLGSGAGDQLVFLGYAIGDTFTRINATHWSINSEGGSVSEVITISNGAAFYPTDYSFVITGGNATPVAVADTNGGDAVTEAGVVGAGDPTATGNVLLNDTDADAGDARTVQGVAAGSAAGPLVTGAGAAITGFFGSVTIAANGAWTYTLDNDDPDTEALAQGQAVSDVFSYTMKDTAGATSTATLTIDITGVVDTPDIDLFALTASRGFHIFGADAGDLAGFSVSSAGDVNGDGFDDVIVGALTADGPANDRSSAGESYVIFGRTGGFADIDLATLTGSQGIRIFGADGYDNSSVSVSSAGDVNGDGFDDLIIGAQYANAFDNLKSNAGESHVIFGAAGLADLDLATLTAGQGFRIFGADAQDQSGFSVSSAGDVNGDGLDDVIIGAHAGAAFGNAKAYAGESYVIFGQSAGLADIDLFAPLTASQGFRIFGAESGDQAGKSVSSAGDVNGDGFDDLIIGAYRGDASGNAKNEAGESYVIFGQAAGFADVDLAAPLGTRGFRIFGADAYDQSGWSVSSAGDVNGDGFDDFVIGANRADSYNETRYSAGESYVIFGEAALGVGDIDLATLTASQGFRILGAEGGDLSSWSVSSAGDVNGDGFDDLIVGAPGASASGNEKSAAGESYVVFGQGSGLTNIDLATLTESQGFRIFGADIDDTSGWSVSSAGDVNGDGFDDLVVGARNADAADNAKLNAGESYVIYGGDFLGSVTFAGTAGANTLTGTAAAEIFVGGQGNDTMMGGGGADVFQGGAGDDAIQVADTSFRHADGGSGVDVLRLMGSGLTLDLTALANNKTHGIERVDLTGSGNNTLELDLSDVLDLSDSTNEVFVNGNVGDSVDIAGGGWTNDGVETHDSVNYTRYTNGEAGLLVEQGITTTLL